MLNRMSLKGTVIKNGEILKFTVEFTEVELSVFTMKCIGLRTKRLLVTFFCFCIDFNEFLFVLNMNPVGIFSINNCLAKVTLMISDTVWLVKLESAKLRAYVLTCQRVLRAYVLTCQCALRAYVPTCLACLRDHVSCVLACSLALLA